MASNMQIHESISYTTATENLNQDPVIQMASSPTSSTLTEFTGINYYLQQHMRTVMNCLEDPPPSPPRTRTSISTIHFEAVQVDPCQDQLTWDVQEDISTDDMEDWLDEIPYYSAETHPSPAKHNTEISGWSSSTSSTTSSEAWKTKFPSFELPPLDVSPSARWETLEQYSPSICLEDESSLNEVLSRPLGDAARELRHEISMAPINYISIKDILQITPKMHEVCAEIRATVNRAEDSAEFDSDSDSDSDYNSEVSSLDLNKYWATVNIFSNRTNVQTSSNETHSILRLRRHYVSPDIRSRVRAACGLTIDVPSLQYDRALLTDETSGETK